MTTDNYEYELRLNRLQALMRDKALDGMLIAQNVDLYYLNGSMQTGYLFVPTDGEPTFFVRKSLSRALTESVFPVESLQSMKQLAASLADAYPASFGEGKRPTIGVEFDVLPVQHFERLRAALPSVEWADGSPLIRKTRMVKTASELARIRQAAAVIDRALEDGLSSVHEGMTEIELLATIEFAIRKEGHIGIMRTRGFNSEVITGMLGAGAAAALPTYFDGPAGGLGLCAASPQSASRTPIRRGDPILLDVGCCIDGYVIDQTRIAVIGDLPEELKSMYDVSVDILQAIERRLQPGTLCEDIYAESLAHAERAGLKEHFMGYGPDQVKFVGHGIGLEIDELPVLARGFKVPLEPGMVLAIEPKFTLPERGVVGIENCYAITDVGYEKLTVSREGLIVL